MIRETYKAKVLEKKRGFPEAEFVEITRSKEHVLSPTWALYNLYKQNHDWEMYTRLFIKQMEAQACKDEMKRLWDLAQTKDVFLVCYEKDGENCHRHLVISLMQARFGNGYCNLEKRHCKHAIFEGEAKERFRHYPNNEHIGFSACGGEYCPEGKPVTVEA